MNTLRMKPLLCLLILLTLASGCSFGKHEPTIAPFISTSDNPVEAQANSLKYNDCPFTIPSDMPADRMPKFVCATLTVPEDWGKRDGPTIDLAVAIVKTTSTTPKPDPVLVLIGNPGYGTDFAYAMPFLFPSIFAQRDFIIVDQRGSGHSQPLFSCPDLASQNFNALSESSLKEANDQFVKASESCANTVLASGVDLNAYTTSTMAADMEALRQALAISQWNIFSISNGSRLALEMMRDYPHGVRSVVMDSPVPPQANPAAEWGPNALATLDRYFQRCADDENCGKAYPRLKETFYSLLDQIDAKPIQIDVSDLNTGNSYNVALDSEKFLTFLLGRLTEVDDIQTLAEVPRMIYQLRAEKTEAAARLLGASGINGLPPSAMSMWVDCNEEMNFITLDQINQSNEPIGKQLRQYFNTQAEASLNACKPWRAPGGPASENKPVSSSIPTLLLAGEFDWAEPPTWADQTAQYLKTSTVVKFSGAGQVVYASSQWSVCSHTIVDAFLASPEAKPDKSCADATNKITWITLP